MLLNIKIIVLGGMMRCTKNSKKKVVGIGKTLSNMVYKLIQYFIFKKRSISF